MNKEVLTYNENLSVSERDICLLLASLIATSLQEASSKIWHAHPVWFLNENPVVGYSKVKSGIKLLFWSGQSFDEGGLKASGSFKAAEVLYISVEQIKPEDVKRWLDKSRDIQWDYKNIVKRKGVLERLK